MGNSMEHAWKFIGEMISEGAVHKTKRFSLNKADISFIASHILEEAEEFMQSVKDNDPDVDELADIFGCLVHACIKLNVSPEVLKERLFYKLSKRFERG